MSAFCFLVLSLDTTAPFSILYSRTLIRVLAWLQRRTYRFGNPLASVRARNVQAFPNPRGEWQRLSPYQIRLAPALRSSFVRQQLPAFSRLSSRLCSRSIFPRALNSYADFFVLSRILTSRKKNLFRSGTKFCRVNNLSLQILASTLSCSANVKLFNGFEISCAAW